MVPTRARQALVVALLLGLIDQAIFYGTGIGLNLPVAVCLALAAAWIARRREAAVDPLDRWLAPASIALAVPIALRGDGVISGLDAVASVGLGVAAVASFNGAAITRRTAMAAAAVLGATAVLFLAGG